MLALMLLLADDPMLAKARSLLSAERRCESLANATDITVCGLRRADRYRVPFVQYEEGDRRHESVDAERVRLLHRTTPVQDMGPFQVGGGMTGVSVGTNGVNGTGATKRKLAP